MDSSPVLVFDGLIVVEYCISIFDNINDETSLSSFFGVLFT